MATGKEKRIEGDTQNSKKDTFKGFNLDEIRYRKALLMLKSEFAKEKFLQIGRETVDNSPLSHFKNGKNNHAGVGVLGKMMKGLSFVDYAILGFTAFKNIKHLFSLFRRKK